MFGLGKNRSKLGKWLDALGMSQQWLSQSSKINRRTISKITNEKDYLPTATTIKKILAALRKVDPNIKADDFWEI